ncbi:MAG: glycosyltransferase family 39 protein, partial [Chloroflexi bacterium]|nr:glycosyltransferase family 39 protein [Chloroflexota bacterium]
MLALALFARLWQIDSFPFGTWYDEADNGNYAVRMLNDPTFRPVYVESTNLPAHFLYLTAFSFKLFGVSTISMRFVTAAFGIATVVFAYLLFRRWFGEPVGLLAAGMFVVLRYDLTFSRIALHGVTTPAFELLVLYLLDRALQRKRLLDFALVGVALGFGLAFYAPFRLFPFALIVAMGVLIAIALRADGRRQMTDDGRQFGVIRPEYLAVVLAGALIAMAPVAEYALQNRDVFFARTNTVSIFERRDEPDLVRALWSNTLKHLEMFNVQGDRNGRHNLPNEPTLDPIMGALAVLGLALALWRWRDPTNLLMLSVFGVMLLGGILTVDFEAPQSLRAIGVMPALVYFAVVPLAAVSHEFARVFTPKGQARRERGSTTLGPSPLSPTRFPIALGGVVLLAAITWSNFDTFFNRQKNSFEVWAA